MGNFEMGKKYNTLGFGELVWFWFFLYFPCKLNYFFNQPKYALRNMLMLFKL